MMPSLRYEPHIVSGAVRQRFDVWLEPGAQFFTEWRDTTLYPQNVGPSVRFVAGGDGDPEGRVSGGGRQLAAIPARTWVRVEIEAEVGRKAARAFRLVIAVAGRDPQVFTDLPMSGRDFTELHWIGFSSIAAADAAFYLDPLEITRPR